MSKNWLLVGLSSAFLLTSCASTTPVSGIIYSDVQGPVAVTSNPRGPLHGEACAMSYLGLVATGDASISTAAKNGGINVISHVEQASTSILFFYMKYCTEVWGFKGGSKAAAASPAAATPAAPASN